MLNVLGILSKNMDKRNHSNLSCLTLRVHNTRNY